MIEVNGKPTTRMYIATRGGSFLLKNSICKSAVAFDQSEYASSWVVGLRLVREATPQKRTEPKALNERVFYKLQIELVPVKE